MKRYREWNPRQTILLPSSLLAWLPRDRAVYFVLDVVNAIHRRAGLRPHQ